mgnify:CR=1 FL=1
MVVAATYYNRTVDIPNHEKCVRRHHNQFSSLSSLLPTITMSDIPWEILDARSVCLSIKYHADVAQAKLNWVKTIKGQPMTFDTLCTRKAEFTVDLEEQSLRLWAVGLQKAYKRLSDDRDCEAHYLRFENILKQLETEVMQMNDKTPPKKPSCCSRCRCNIL